MVTGLIAGSDPEAWEPHAVGRSSAHPQILVEDICALDLMAQLERLGPLQRRLQSGTHGCSSISWLLQNNSTEIPDDHQLFKDAVSLDSSLEELTITKIGGAYRDAVPCSHLHGICPAMAGVVNGKVVSC